MEQALPEGVVQGWEGALVKEEWVAAGCEERSLELDPVGIVFAPIVGLRW